VSRVHCGSAFDPGTWRSPHYCAQLVCVLNFSGELAVCRFYKQTSKQTNKPCSPISVVVPSIPIWNRLHCGFIACPWNRDRPPAWVYDLPWNSGHWQISFDLSPFQWNWFVTGSVPDDDDCFYYYKKWFSTLDWRSMHQCTMCLYHMVQALCSYHMVQALCLSRQVVPSFQNQHLTWFKGFSYQKTIGALIKLRKLIIKNRSRIGPKSRLENCMQLSLNNPSTFSTPDPYLSRAAWVCPHWVL